MLPSTGLQTFTAQSCRELRRQNAMKNRADYFSTVANGGGPLTYVLDFMCNQIGTSETSIHSSLTLLTVRVALRKV